VHVLPRSGRTEIVGVHDGALKIRVAAPPVDGRATEAARVALAGGLGVPTAAVTLTSGERSRLKCFRVTGIDVNAAEEQLRPFLGPVRG
jgi:uncharacterized protein YggU (UPF0235/DUF167 family)